MAITLTPSNVNKYLAEVLASLNEGKIDQLKARNDIAQALTLAAFDKDDDFKSYISVDEFKARWKLK